MLKLALWLCTQVTFVDNGMDESAACTPQAGGCKLSYTYNPNITTESEKGVLWTFTAGSPNIAAVRA